MRLTTSAPPATAKAQASEIDGIRLLQLSGCSRLCVVLGGLGLAFSLGAATATHQLLHEPLESVAAASSLHMAAAFCTANDAVLTRLALAQSEALSKGHGMTAPAASIRALHTSPGHPPAAAPVQVAILELASGTDQLLLPAPAVLAPALSQLGLTALLGSRQPPTTGSGRPSIPRPPHQIGRSSRPHLTACNDHGLGEIRKQTRVYALAGGDASTPSSPRLVYVLGPWPMHADHREMAVAITDLPALVSSIGELDAHNKTGSHEHRQGLNITNVLLPRDRVADDAWLDTSLDPSDLKLSNARSLGFANSDLVSLVRADHAAIDRTSRRAAALAFVMGLSTTMIVVLISRYSQLKLLHLNRALRRESRTDGLTKLANRRAWDEALLRADQLRQRQADTYAVVVIDLDGFKQINDSQGHHQGDQVLIQAAEALRRIVREADLAARLGGDEFGILLVNPSQEGLNECVDRLRTALGSLSIKASIGSSMSQRNTSLEVTWAEADGSMYQVKRS